MVSRRLVALLLIAILGPWLAVGLFFFTSRPHAAQAPAGPQSAPAATGEGATPSSPWLLMKYEDVVAFYPSDQPLDIQRYRPNALAPY